MWFFKPKKEVKPCVKQTKQLSSRSERFNIGKTMLEIADANGRIIQVAKYGYVTQITDPGNNSGYNMYGYISMKEPSAEDPYVVSSLGRSKNFLIELPSSRITIVNDQREPTESYIIAPISAKILSTEDYFIDHPVYFVELKKE